MTEVKDIESQEVVEEAAAKGKKDKKSKVTVMKGVAVEEDGMRVAGVHINQLRMPLVGMFVSATVLLISVLSWKQTANPIRWREHAISVPAVTTSLSFLFILMTCKESLYKKNGKHANIVLFTWNFVGACLLTFIDPFTTTGNGCELHVERGELHLSLVGCVATCCAALLSCPHNLHVLNPIFLPRQLVVTPIPDFASWMMAICSAAALGLSANTLASSVQGAGALVGLLAASIVVIIAISPSLGKGNPCRNESICTITVASVALAVILAHVAKEKKQGQEKSGGVVAVITLGFFAILWLVLAGLTTLRGPFLTTGNGRFASWAGAAMACFAAMAARKMTKQEKQQQGGS